MTWFVWSFRILAALAVAGFLHYTLPQRDVVRIVNTDVRRIDFGSNSIFWADANTGQAQDTGSRDIFFIDAFRENGRPIVYRNEDTGWGWPPYFKLNSANLQAEARDLVSSSEDPKWAVVRHYGWRAELISIYPNALSVRAVESPDVRLVPWFNIVVLTLLACLFWGLWVRWRRFRERRIDPVFERVEDEVIERGSAARGRLRRLFGRG